MVGSTSAGTLGDRLEQAWLQSCTGAGRTVVLLGDPGIGKSSALAQLAHRIGPTAHVVSCRGGDIAAPMSAAAEIAAVLPITTPVGSVAGEVDALRVADILSAGLARAAGTTLLIDDIHDADAASRTALNLAMRRSADAAVFVVVTGRRVPSAESFAEGFDVEELTGLDRAAATAVLEAASTVPIAPAVIEQLLHVAAGNPLVLRHLPDALTPEQLSGAQLLPEHIPLVGDLRAVFSRQLPRPGTAGRTLLELASLSADGSWSVLRSMRPGIAEAALHTLEDSGLAALHSGRLTLQHPLLRSATVAAMSHQQQRRLHLEFADCTALSDTVRLVHRAHGTLGPDEALVDELVGAARTLRSRGGTEPAARLLDRAIDLTGDDSRRAELRVLAARQLVAAGQTDSARYRLETVLADPASHELHVAATVLLATLEAVGGAPAMALHRLKECAVVASPAEAGVVHARMAIPLGMLGMVGEIIDTATAAVALSDPLSTDSHVARVILAHALSARHENRSDQLVDGIPEQLDLVAAVTCDPMIGLHYGRALSIAERYEASAAALTELSAQLRGEGARSALAMVFGALGETYVRASRFDDALMCLDEATALSLATGQRAFAPFWLSLRARVHAIRGDDHTSAADLELGFAISDELSTFGARYFLLANAGLAALTARRPDDAVAALSECWAFEQVGGLLAPQLARWHIDLVEAYLAVGRSDDARPVVEHLQTVAAAVGSSRWTRATACRAEALLRRGTDPAGSLRLLHQATAIYDPAHDAFDRARTFHDIARLAADASDREHARAEARNGFSRLGAAAWAAKVDRRTPELSALTEAESRVLTEVANGLTNQQIAKRLGLSAKTVANHLYRAYRKLGVASRTEAVRFVLLHDDKAGESALRT
ncbi:MAG: LuxR C-terminal-related transcriptional regulator [Mycobacterium sp.]|nr:LuxR C-terminal-related transcriptional regulator [Mycobacterium sp.]